MDILEAFKELNKIDEGDSSIQEEGLKHQISKAVMDVYDKALDQIVTSYEFKRGCEYFMEVLSDGYSALVDYDCPWDIVYDFFPHNSNDVYRSFLHSEGIDPAFYSRRRFVELVNAEFKSIYNMLNSQEGQKEFISNFNGYHYEPTSEDAEVYREYILNAWKAYNLPM